jgi:RNA polymerase sigma-70 factor (ECF subfamily)
MANVTGLIAVRQVNRALRQVRMAIGIYAATEKQIARAAESDDFGAIFTTYQSAIYNYTLRMIGNVEDAADLTLAAFEKALRAWARRPADLQVRPWLYRIATNTCLDELRHRSVIRWQSLDPVDGAIPHPVAPDNPERTVLQAEQSRLVRAALDQLPERYRVALVLRESEGLSCEEIGEALGISRSAAKVLLFRARERLRKVYFAADPTEERPSALRRHERASEATN